MIKLSAEIFARVREIIVAAIDAVHITLDFSGYESIENWSFCFSI